MDSNYNYREEDFMERQELKGRHFNEVILQGTFISPEEKGMLTSWLPDFIHTSRRSESSDISLYVLGEIPMSPI